MQAFSDFIDMPTEFWVFVKFVSEKLHYSARKKSTIRTYSEDEIKALCKRENIYISQKMLEQSIQYFDMRANLLNNFVEKMLMDLKQAHEKCSPLLQLHEQNKLLCKLPLNKQSGNMKQISYFTAIINILTEITTREYHSDISTLQFDDDPHRMAYIWDNNHVLLGSTSRRFDGAYPSINNPKIVWEIKEYYYTTTFGSRIADAIYETQLDGYEFKELFDRTGKKVYHVLFIDAYETWWNKGKSYLCRIIDALNMGLVDEVIVGKEVFDRWPKLLKSIL